MTPDKQIVWNYDGPPGTEIHTTWPVDRDRVLDEPGSAEQRQLQR